MLIDNKYFDYFNYGKENEKFFLIRKYIPGEIVDKFRLSENLCYNIGEKIAYFHNTPTRCSKVLKVQDTSDIFYEWLNDVKLYFSNIELNNIVNTFEKNNKMFYNKEHSLTHMDFRLGNIIQYKESSVELIDFESARLTDVFFDFVKIKDELYNKNYNYWNQFAKGYKDSTNIDLNSKYAIQKINFFKFIHGIGGLSYIYKKNRTTTDPFYIYNKNYILNYLKG